MMNTPWLRLSGCMLLVLATTTLEAQDGPRPTPLRGERIELPQPMTLITGLHPLPDGRVVAVDVGEKAIRIVDFGARTATQIGREGQGPNEYRTPRTTLAWLGDTVLVYDGGQRRLLKVSPRGQLAGQIGIEGSMFMNRGVTPPRWATPGRHIYFEIEPLEFLRDDKAPRRALIARWTPGAQQLDSVAALMVREPTRATSGRAPFARHDGWGVTPDGLVAIVRALDYRVEWLREGEAPLIGAAAPWTPVPVTDREREVLEESLATGPRPTASVSGGSGESSSSTRSSRRSSAAADYPEVKPPFEAKDRLGRPGVTVTPEGELWVTQSRAWNDSIPIVDVFDRRGRLVRRIQLPPHSRVLYANRDAVYLARRDSDDLEWLIRVVR